ncbi:MAG TPA: hypothetical protein VD996_14800 [Chitinophagaceae bacterium]|nr:hypothetical protein [Chitinophagaceae bacterium]
MINEQINMALNELLKMNLGFTDLSSICSFANHSNDKVYRYVYSIGDTLSNKKLRSLISTTISNQAIKNDCVVFHQADSIRVEKKIYSR